MYDEVLLTTNDILRPFKRTMVEIGTCCISRNLVLANILVLLQKTLRFWENNGLYAHETFGSNIGCHLFKEVVRRLRITGWRPLRPLLTSCFAFVERFSGSLAWETGFCVEGGIFNTCFYPLSCETTLSGCWMYCPNSKPDKRKLLTQDFNFHDVVSPTWQT